MIPFEASTVATSLLKVGERVIACSISLVILPSVERTRGIAVWSSCAIAGPPREQAIDVTSDARSFAERRRWWTVMTSSSPDRVERVLTTGGERDVEQLQDFQNQAKNKEMAGPRVPGPRV